MVVAEGVIVAVAGEIVAAGVCARSARKDG
jgi:hypothetical protein